METTDRYEIERMITLHTVKIWRELKNLQDRVRDLEVQKAELSRQVATLDLKYQRLSAKIHDVEERQGYEDRKSVV